MTIDEIKVEHIEPTGEYMLIKSLQEKEITSKSGIILNVGSQGATATLGEVVKAGELSNFKVGSTVMFRRYSLDEIELKNIGKFNFIANDDVIAVCNP